MTQTEHRASQADFVAAESGCSEAAEAAICTLGLRKVFGTKVAVRGLTLRVRRGEAFGFLGPNGAGKSTSIKMLLGLVRPTLGSASVLGKPAGDRETRGKLGFLPEHFRFYDWLTSHELLRAHGELCGLSGSALQKRIGEMLDLVGLTPHAGKQLRAYSKGMLQRVGLAQALIHRPDLIFLDEPTSGLDPVGRRLVRDIIRMEKARGATVFLNSHLLSEVEVTCDRVAFIRAGNVVEMRAMEEFESSKCNVAARVGVIQEGVLRGLDEWATEVSYATSQLSMKLKDASFAPCVVEYLVHNSVEVFEFTSRRVSLEDRFMEILGVDDGL